MKTKRLLYSVFLRVFSCLFTWVLGTVLGTKNGSFWGIKTNQISNLSVIYLIINICIANIYNNSFCLNS